MSETDWIELRPGVPWTTATELNRIARQQGLCLAMAQASVYDEICQVIDLPEQIEQRLVKTYEAGQGINTSDQRRQFLQQRGWSAEDLCYFATKGERVEMITKLSVIFFNKLIIISPCYESSFNKVF